MNENLIISDEIVLNKIHLLRGQKVMLDRDLASLYGVTTGNLNKSVIRNIKRFPSDFMFKLNISEFKNLKFQIGTSSWGGIRKLPYAFTEHGVAMLSGVLNSDRAITVNIQIMRIYTRMRKMLITHKDILLKMEQVENKLLKQDEKMNKYENDIKIIFTYLKELLNPPQEPRNPIGFKLKPKDDKS